MPLFPARLPIIAVLGLATLGASACAPLRSHQGYVIDAALTDAIQPGVDTRESVQATLGRPTIPATFNDPVWYYVSRNSRNYAFNQPSAKDQVTLKIRFDAQGKVVAVDRTGAELIASVDPSNKKTPTLGRERNFFEDLFGNIGTVGAPGMTGGTNGPQ